VLYVRLAIYNLSLIELISASVQISPTKAASLLAKLSDLQYPKVVDAYPGSDAEGMIAVGLGNGKVVLTSFGATIISKEFGKFDKFFG